MFQQKKQFGRETGVPGTDLHYILHARSCIHFLWFQHSPRPPEASKTTSTLQFAFYICFQLLHVGSSIHMNNQRSVRRNSVSALRRETETQHGASIALCSRTVDFASAVKGSIHLLALDWAKAFGSISLDVLTCLISEREARLRNRRVSVNCSVTALVASW